MLSSVGLSLHARHRLALAAAAFVLLVMVFAIRSCGEDGDQELVTTEVSAEERKRPELPRGGRRLFPDFRVVALYGNPRAAELGELGIGTPTRAGIKLENQARPYARKTRPVLPAMELIATIATAAPGPRGDHREPMPDSMIARYHRAARKMKALLILDIQPGRAKFGPDIARLEPLRGVEPSYFELLTAAAFSWFAELPVDAAVIEVGLPGRFELIGGGRVAGPRRPPYLPFTLATSPSIAASASAFFWPWKSQRMRLRSLVRSG